MKLKTVNRIYNFLSISRIKSLGAYVILLTLFQSNFESHAQTNPQSNPNTLYYSNPTQIETAQTWHQSFPTIGLKMFHKPTYPFLPHFFTLRELAPHQGKGITVTIVDSQKNAPNNLHLAHLNNLLTELCPKATIHAVSAYNDGTCTKSDLIKAVQKAHILKTDIIVLPLKIDDSINPTSPASKLLNSELSKIPFVIAAAGNNGTHKLAYPARFAATTFSVGAFGYHNNNCFIPSFSQYENGKGPTFLMPGVHTSTSNIDMNSTAITRNSTDVQNMSIVKNEYHTYTTGTSPASAILAALTALALSESRQVPTSKLTNKQIEIIFTMSALRPHNTYQWETHTSHGILDIRMALFIIHNLTTSSKKFNKISDNAFHIMIAQLKEALLKPLTKVRNDLTAYNFSHEFIEFIKDSNSRATLSPKDPLVHKLEHMNLEQAITYTKKLVRRQPRACATGQGACSDGRSTTRKLKKESKRVQT